MQQQRAEYNRNNKFVFLIIVNSKSDLLKLGKDYSKSDGNFYNLKLYFNNKVENKKYKIN